MGKIKDLTGQKFGKLVVLYKDEDRQGRVCWVCKCDCGNLKSIESRHLKNGNTKSCGCLQKERASEIHRKDLVGSKFGRWSVLEHKGVNQNQNSLYLCQCVCGNEKIIRSDILVSGSTKSCGCYHKESARNRMTTHGLSKTTEYIRHNKLKRREREKLLDSYWTLEMEIVLQKFQPVCIVCGGTDRLATDHVLPLSKSNGLKPGNAVRLCIHCNSSKLNKKPHDLPPDMRGKILKSALEFKRHWERSVSLFIYST
jgi:5-methylcytosine-specific restriction endonuclease McrA